ncbi:hypothetical protein EYF80_038008 [Liparis tanakae]|uniref:Uncharacterized protein n=1 Tax=Liparis tanakae TaxID=230148 RepID=A0A4Z2GET0_9TELE|nr:hypothetical protein EYF80_038008 [Liparis tanakae]
MAHLCSLSTEEPSMDKLLVLHPDLVHALVLQQLIEDHVKLLQGLKRVLSCWPGLLGNAAEPQTAGYNEWEKSVICDGDLHVISSVIRESKVVEKQSPVFKHQDAVTILRPQGPNDIKQKQLVHAAIQLQDESIFHWEIEYHGYHAPHQSEYRAQPTPVFQMGVVLFETLHRDDFVTTKFITNCQRIRKTVFEDKKNVH